MTANNKTRTDLIRTPAYYLVPSFPQKIVLFLLSAIFASTLLAVQEQEFADQPDELCKLLFDSYIARQGKIEGSTVLAASHIIAERGRYTFWRVVLGELQQGKAQSEVGCVRVLGKMLYIEAYERDRMRMEKETGHLDQFFHRVCLGPEVVKELITRGNVANRINMDHYAIALARARVPEATEFFRIILRNDPGLNAFPSTQFHAAVGLAQLGEPDGFTWLIENSENQGPTVSNACPRRISNPNIDTCAVAALRDLSGEQYLKSKQDWQLWWDKVDKNALPKKIVIMIDE